MELLLLTLVSSRKNADAALFIKTVFGSAPFVLNWNWTMLKTQKCVGANGDSEVISCGGSEDTEMAVL
jgi:hypothetical protein